MNVSQLKKKLDTPEQRLPKRQVSVHFTQNVIQKVDKIHESTSKPKSDIYNILVIYALEKYQEASDQPKLTELLNQVSEAFYSGDQKQQKACLENIQDMFESKT